MTKDDVRRCCGGTWWGDEPGRAHSSAGRAASGRASSASWWSKTSGGRGGRERNYEKIRFCGGRGSGWGQHVRHCGEEVRGPRGRRTRATTTTRGRAATVRVEDAGDGRGLPPPSPATGPYAGGRSRGPRRQGETIAKGHKNYELMLNLQLGIRHAVGKQGQITLDLKSSAFDPKEKVWTRFPPEGSKYTPTHSSCDFKWKDYCPQVFRTLRKLFKVDAADYMLSLCGDQALRELSSPGKSGSFFYLTSNDQYMIKTMKKSEVKIFLKMLRAYYNHVRAFENTLVTKFFGLHCVKLAGANQKKTDCLDRFAKIKLGSNMPIRAERTIRKIDVEPQIIGEPTGEFYDVVLYFGIIDILQDYDISKKLEHAYKSFQYDPTSISAVDPKQYSRRFRDFVFKAFQEEKFDL
nr:unnamed protein product [Digitaria exilis]